MDARVEVRTSATELIWRRLSPLLAARRSMRVYDPVARSFDQTRPLTSKRPGQPAAVPLFYRGRARVIALDFDPKHLDAAAVDQDVCRVLEWLSECGGRAVVDRSTRGGRHVLVPLAPGVTVSVEEIRPLLDQLAARLPTLDIVPMCNAASGCITVPGSLCRDGGYRRLEGELDVAIDALVVGSDSAAVPRLLALLGGSSRVANRPKRTVQALADNMQAATYAERIVGGGTDAHLHPRFCKTSTPTEAVQAFAARGVLDKTRWKSRSEARQSVVTQFVMAGATVADVIARAQTPAWSGLRAAYDHYRDPRLALQRDAANALKWAASTLPEPVRDTGHKFKYTGGAGDPLFMRWQQQALSWVTSEYQGRRDRWTTLAVVQALAWSASVAGEIVEGVPVVAVGGRSLSIAAGMLPESTVWSVLERLREAQGSPLLLIERGVGQLADRYALVTAGAESVQDRKGGSPGELAEVESVHPAWSVLGYRQKALYEAVQRRSGASIDSVLAEVRIGRSSGYEALMDLRVAGLVETNRYHEVSLGRVGLDELAQRHGLKSAVRERVVRHRAERIVWKQWLVGREEAHLPAPPPAFEEGLFENALCPPAAEYLEQVVASGPTEWV
ncbi:hypothetical protein [Rhodococcus sp. 06-156-3C]|uniref:hypothetical protein n=1 Tax=Rhodococcus sp. 06-156-3C TaxID=2022486 RepID=UPI0011404A48|nr:MULTISPECIES: hypothetical protein [unclassified Rhodococcus (in: high G+C Gram-positive bacteria)]